MLKILNEERNPVVSSIFTARAACEEIQESIEKISKHVKGKEKVNWYIELEDIYDPLPEKILECFSSLDKGLVNRIAVVGEKEQHSLASYLDREFSASKIKFFLLQDQEVAHKWIAGKELI